MFSAFDLTIDLIDSIREKKEILMTRFFITALLLMVGLSAQLKIEVLKMQETPYNENAIIKKMYAETGVVGSKYPLVLQVGEFPIGVSVPNRPEWLKGMRENGNGSTILLWVYGENGFQKRFYLSQDDATSFVEDKTYFKDRFRKYFQSGDLPNELEGKKIAITAILVNGYGESLKIARATSLLTVDYMKKSDVDNGMLEKVLKGPRIYFNEPYGNYKVDQPIMVDYYVYNADIGTDAYTVNLYIDGNLEEVLYDWAPYRVKNLMPGIHEFKLVLIDPKGKPVPDAFGEQKNYISIGE